MKAITFNIDPVSKPRMTQRDKWLRPPRPCVAKYWFFKEELSLLAKKKRYKVGDTLRIIFYIPMPKSWSKKKKKKMLGMPHQQVPDRDNLLKAFTDALMKDDSKIWHGETTKRWSRKGKIIVYISY